MPREDVLVVGAGFAGTAAALALARLGLAVALIDTQHPPRPAFRAEKLSADQWPLLDALGLLEPMRDAGTLATQAINIRGARIVDRVPVHDLGLMYADMVTLLRRQLPPQVRFVCARVAAVQADADGAEAVLADGRCISARLLVLATGTARGLRHSLGITHRVVSPVPTLGIAFTLAPPPHGGWRFPSLAAYGEVTGDGVDYTSIFPVGGAMRVNVFAFGAPGEPRFGAFRRDPMAALLALQPGLAPWLDGAAAATRAELFVVEVARCDGARRPGVVLIGDACGTSCPAVGSGLSCGMTDVVRLADWVPQWLRTPGIGSDKIAQFYDDAQKTAMDRHAHQRALQRRAAATGRSLTNRMRRAAHFARRRLVDRFSAYGT